MLYYLRANEFILVSSIFFFPPKGQGSIFVERSVGSQRGKKSTDVNFFNY